jgi:hypothetical protein
MIRVEHEMHHRRKGRNIGVGLCLVGVIVVVFGLSVVKVTLGHNIERFDHVARPALEQVAE